MNNRNWQWHFFRNSFFFAVFESLGWCSYSYFYKISKIQYSCFYEFLKMSNKLYPYSQTIKAGWLFIGLMRIPCFLPYMPGFYSRYRLCVTSNGFLCYHGVSCSTWRKGFFTPICVCVCDAQSREIFQALYIILKILSNKNEVRNKKEKLHQTHYLELNWIIE